MVSASLELVDLATLVTNGEYWFELLLLAALIVYLLTLRSLTDKDRYSPDSMCMVYYLKVNLAGKTYRCCQQQMCL